MIDGVGVVWCVSTQRSLRPGVAVWVFSVAGGSSFDVRRYESVWTI